jgi:hypothetical protein
MVPFLYLTDYRNIAMKQGNKEAGFITVGFEVVFDFFKSDARPVGTFSAR